MQRIGMGYGSQRKGVLTRRTSYVTALALTLLINLEVQAEQGNSGMLFVHGALTEGACRLEMTSSYQDIWLGDTTTGSLAAFGSRATPVAFQLKLRDCTRMGAAIKDTRLGYRVWDAYQPAVTASFTAPADADNPQLVQVQGVSGLGLRLLDGNKNDVRLGSLSRPQLLALGDNGLQFYVMAERTRAPLLAGVYHAVIDFRMNYD
ncbi:type 1 fimbrial protein [Serratia plymuthica]|uniref:fimbrial protein n=1 Tax=Serratia plymuthica TaxID=82996 RepID=UPI0019270CE3|nr:fimbrial protein [Serratia plymuthica]MBL3523567.1 type 1 fimbrial protein [Serratia plymuthica]